MKKETKTIKDFTPEVMQMFAEVVGSLLPHGIGFSLLIFNTDGKEAEVKYISSANREDMRASMECLVKKWNSEKVRKN